MEAAHISWIHGGSSVTSARYNHRNRGDGYHPRLHDRAARAPDDDPEHGQGDDEGQRTFRHCPRVKIHLQGRPAQHALVLGRHDFHDRQSPSHRPSRLRSGTNRRTANDRSS